MPGVQSADRKSGDIARLSLRHYDLHARDLPWRKLPGQGLPDPYHVWLSEIMLQQTTVAAVRPYFQKFVETWPDFFALAQADDADVMAAWAGLGYYARARNLVKCARAVAGAHDGRLPDNEADLLKLPGIGAYTAAAITAIAFGRRAIVVDANVERVIARLFAISTPLPSGKPLIRHATGVVTPTLRAGDFAQAMMDLGAGLCSVRAPACRLCPLNVHCSSHALGDPEAYPVKATKKPKPKRTGSVYWISRDDKVWLIQRPASGMLGGMRAYPDDHWTARADGSAGPPAPAEWRWLDTRIDHVFTHFSLELRVAVTAWPTGLADPGEGIWWPVNSLDKAGLPTLFNKVTKAVIASGE